jgi:hypothetical protein
MLLRPNSFSRLDLLIATLCAQFTSTRGNQDDEQRPEAADVSNGTGPMSDTITFSRASPLKR